MSEPMLGQLFQLILQNAVSVGTLGLTLVVERGDLVEFAVEHGKKLALLWLELAHELGNRDLWVESPPIRCAISVSASCPCRVSQATHT